MSTTSPFATLITALQARIKEQVPAINWIDQDMGQLEAYTDRPPLKFPAVLIDFTNFKFEDMAEAIQFVDGIINIRLIFAPFSNSTAITPEIFQDKALSYYDIEWEIYKSLHGWKPENYGYMMRASVSTEKRNDGLRVRVISFSISFEDYNAEPEKSTVNLPRDLNIENI